LRAGVGRALLPGPGPDQQIAQGIGVTGQVREHVPARPAGQQRRLPELGVGDDPRRAEQALGRVVDLVTQLALRGVHLITIGGGRSASPEGYLRRETLRAVLLEVRRATLRDPNISCLRSVSLASGQDVAAPAVSMACRSLASSADISPIAIRSSGLMKP